MIKNLIRHGNFSFSFNFNSRAWLDDDSLFILQWISIQYYVILRNLRSEANK